MKDETVDLWALDEVHFQQQGSRCRMWVPPEIKDPVIYHHPTRKSVGYFAAVRLRDGQFLFRREIGRFNGDTFWEFLKMFREVSTVRAAVACWQSATTPNTIVPNCTWDGGFDSTLNSGWTSCHPIAP